MEYIYIYIFLIYLLKETLKLMLEKIEGALKDFV